MAGVPFDVLEQLSTPAIIAGARALLVRGEKETAETAAALQPVLEDELRIVRRALLQSSSAILPKYLVFGEGGVRYLLNRLLEGNSSAGERRNAKSGDRERHLLLYLQRVCSKNDTFSEFGPSAWGTVAEGHRLQLILGTDARKRNGFLERWTAYAVAAALNADQSIKPELCPRLHPAGRLSDGVFIFTDTGENITLDEQTQGILQRCDGKTPAHSLGTDLDILEQLTAQRMLRWEIEVPRLEVHAFDVLLSNVARWRDGPARTRWLEALQNIASLPQTFARTIEVNSRIELMERAKHQLDDLGAVAKSSERFLYNAANPIGEDCSRDCSLILGQETIDEVADEIGPWVDLWRDSYAYVASRVAAGLRGFLQTSGAKNGAMPLPAFLRHCEMQKMSLTGHGLVALAHIAFLELKIAFQQLLAQRADASEWTLSQDECHFVRNNFEYAKFDEYTFPSGDFQLSAASIEHANRGECEWLLAELHPPIAMLHHCMLWNCPDKQAFARALASTTCGQPNFFYGFAPADFTAHTTVRQFDIIPECSYFVASEPGNEKWRIIPPSETEVFVNEENGDVALRRIGSHEYLGSFSRYWIIPLGFHPFYFGRAPHMPRLRCGKVIVQRESWTVTAEELGPGKFNGVSSGLVLAIERLRAKRELPRFVYIRPTEQALRRSGAEGRDKDTKPVFIDFESYLFIEIFYRWLTKAGEVEVTEMLPDPDHLLWQEADGRRTFELRTLIVPRE